jgi:ABC-type branched-subunit amino acid transport system ATPase component
VIGADHDLASTDLGHEVPQGAHHWSLIGDSEFREGSLLEAMPEAAERAHGILERTGLSDIAQKPIQDITFGQQKLVGVARALMNMDEFVTKS